MNKKCDMCQKESTLSLINTYDDFKEVCQECKTNFFEGVMKSDSNLKRVKELIDGAKPDFDNGHNGLDLIFIRNKKDMTEAYYIFIKKDKKKN